VGQEAVEDIIVSIRSPLQLNCIEDVTSMLPNEPTSLHH